MRSLGSALSRPVLGEQLSVYRLAQMTSLAKGQRNVVKTHVVGDTAVKVCCTIYQRVLYLTLITENL